jgi:hypothetical protein
VKYWEIIADNLSKAGWSWAACQPWIATGESSGLPTRIRGDGKRFVVRADEKLAVFAELEAAIRLVRLMPCSSYAAPQRDYITEL